MAKTKKANDNCFNKQFILPIEMQAPISSKVLPKSELEEMLATDFGKKLKPITSRLSRLAARQKKNKK